MARSKNAYSCETRLKNERDHRLAPIESFLKALQNCGERLNCYYQPPRTRGPADQAASALLGYAAPEAWSSICHDRQRVHGSPSSSTSDL